VLMVKGNQDALEGAVQQALIEAFETDDPQLRSCRKKEKNRDRHETRQVTVRPVPKNSAVFARWAGLGNIGSSYRTREVDGRVEEARQGQKRAEAALREAMGVGPEFVFVLPKRDLPCPRVNPQLEEVTALALARRGELVQAYTLVEVICLEIDAQATTCMPNMRTFASSSDIHAKPIPSGDMGGVNYRPVIVGPEMPAFLSGSRSARVEQARDYHQRAQAVAAKAHNLIVLEVEDVYRRWLDKSRKATHLETAYREARRFSERVKESFNKRMPSYPNIDEVINAGLVTTRLQLEWKEAHYQSLLALAALERATAGGFSIDFDTAPACTPKELPAEPLDKP